MEKNWIKDHLLLTKDLIFGTPKRKYFSNLFSEKIFTLLFTFQRLKEPKDLRWKYEKPA